MYLLKKPSLNSFSTVKTGLSIGKFLFSLERTRLQVTRMKRDLGI